MACEHPGGMALMWSTLEEPAVIRCEGSGKRSGRRRTSLHGQQLKHRLVVPEIQIASEQITSWPGLGEERCGCLPMCERQPGEPGGQELILLRLQVHRPDRAREISFPCVNHIATFISPRHFLSEGGVNSTCSSSRRSIRSLPEVIAFTAALVRIEETSPISPSLKARTLSASVVSVRFDGLLSGSIHSKLASSCK